MKRRFGVGREAEGRQRNMGVGSGGWVLKVDQGPSWNCNLIVQFNLNCTLISLDSLGIGEETVKEVREVLKFIKTT